MKTKTFLIIRLLALLSALSLLSTGRAATVTGNIVNTTGSPLSTNITFAPLSTPQVNGSNTIASTITTVTSADNGAFSTTLNAGDYKVTIGGAARDSFIITVPTNSATYPLNSLITSALAYNATASPANELKLNKGQTNGYAALNNNALVPTAQLGTGSANSTTYLRGDGSWAVVSMDQSGITNHITATSNALNAAIAGKLGVTNNLNDVASKAATAQNVGVYAVADSSSYPSVPNLSGITGSYPGQVLFNYGVGGIENGTMYVWTGSEWRSGLQLRGPFRAYMSSPVGIGPDGNSGHVMIAAGGADNVLSLQNLSLTNYSAVVFVDASNQ